MSTGRRSYSKFGTPQNFWLNEFPLHPHILTMKVSILFLYFWIYSFNPLKTEDMSLDTLSWYIGSNASIPELDHTIVVQRRYRNEQKLKKQNCRYIIKEICAILNMWVHGMLILLRFENTVVKRRLY